MKRGNLIKMQNVSIESYQFFMIIFSSQILFMKTPVIKAIQTLVVLYLLTGCEHSAIIPATPKQIQLKTSSTLGTYLTDRDGRSLYMFASDRSIKKR